MTPIEIAQIFQVVALLCQTNAAPTYYRHSYEDNDKYQLACQKYYADCLHQEKWFLDVCVQKRKP